MEEKKEMAKMATRSNTKDWPQDLVTEILLKLPIKSMFRFQSASKTWYDLFNTPTFIIRRYSLRKKNANQLFLCVDAHHKIGIRTRLFDDDDDDDKETLVPYHGYGYGYGLPPQMNLPQRVAFLFSFCFFVDNGVVGLSKSTNYGATLWNPATSEFKVLPEFVVNIPVKAVGPKPYHGFGFGWDPVSNDYKVIRVEEYKVKRKPPFRRYFHCAVYWMSKDCWRVLEEDEFQLFTNLRILPICMHTNVYVNGVYNWAVSSYPVGFDISFHFTLGMKLLSN